MNREMLLDEILSFFNVTYDEFCSISRKKSIVRARQVCFYIQYLKGRGVNDIARSYGFDHSNISYAVKTMKNEIQTNDEINDLVTKLYKKYVI